MLHIVTDSVAEPVKQDLADNEDQSTDDDISEWPTVLERVHDQQNLHDEINRYADGV